mgnify:CR=1 FL=1
MALVACALGVASFTTAFAQDTTPTPTPPPCNGASCHRHHHGSVLTADERAELKKDREQVFAANPDLKSEGKDLWEQRKSLKDATPEDKKAYFEKWHAFAQKLNAAIVQVDPNAAPILAKLKAAHHHHHHHHSDANAASDDSNS